MLARVQQAGLIVVAILFIVVGPTLTVIGLTTGREAVRLAAASFVFGSILWLPLSVLGAGLRRVVADRTPLSEMLPAELWAASFAVPVTTAVTAAATSAAVTITSLTIGQQPVLSPDPWRGLAAAGLVYSLAVAVVVPLGVTLRIHREREQILAPLFDPRAPLEAHRRTVAREWQRLHDRPRLWMSERRLAAVGSAAAGSAHRTWPRSWSGPRWQSPTFLLAGLSGLAVLSALSSVTLSQTSLSDDLAYVASITTFTLVVPSLVLALEAYRVLLTEQSRADLLRAAAAQRAERETWGRNGPSDAPQPAEVSLLQLPRRVLFAAAIASRRCRRGPAPASDPPM